MAPSLLSDGPLFFPNVLKDETFQKKGVLTQTEGRTSWAVVDPRRHLMTIWEKDEEDFAKSATKQNASVITNGPFLLYQGGSKWFAYFKYHVESALTSYSVASTNVGLYTDWADFSAKQDWKIKVKYFSSHEVEGYIFGNAERIVKDKNSRPNASYFGRREGRLFPDYEIKRGDPPRHPEVIGGLFMSVENYQVVDNGTASQVGTWGLAPIAPVGDDEGGSLQEAGIDEARQQYEQAARQEGEEIVPLGNGVPPDTACTGLILAAFGPGGPAHYANLNAQVRVQHAVRVDGNNSILLGHYKTLLQGQHMMEIKRIYNRWGYRFRPE